MTYGLNQPRGFQTSRTIGAFTNTGALNEYQIATSAGAIFFGDAVSVASSGTVAQATASQVSVGVFMGCKFQTAANQAVGTFSQQFWPGTQTLAAGTTAIALVADDPNSIWTIQETSSSGASGTPLAQASVGLNANFASTVAGNTTTGLSVMALNNASTATTLVGNMQIVALDPTIVLGVRSATPTQNGGQQAVGAFANWLVRLNTNQYAAAVRPV